MHDDKAGAQTDMQADQESAGVSQSYTPVHARLTNWRLDDGADAYGYAAGCHRRRLPVWLLKTFLL